MACADSDKSLWPSVSPSNRPSIASPRVPEGCTAPWQPSQDVCPSLLSGRSGSGPSQTCAPVCVAAALVRASLRTACQAGRPRGSSRAWWWYLVVQGGWARAAGGKGRLMFLYSGFQKVQVFGKDNGVEAVADCREFHQISIRFAARPNQEERVVMAHGRFRCSRRIISTSATRNATTHCPHVVCTVVFGSVIMKKMKS